VNTISKSLAVGRFKEVRNLQYVVAGVSRRAGHSSNQSTLVLPLSLLLVLPFGSLIVMNQRSHPFIDLVSRYKLR
jgi:hypothetical protein